MDSFQASVTTLLERIAEALERQGEPIVASVPPEGLSTRDAARFLGVEPSTIEHLMRCRRLAYVQHGSQRGRIIPVESLRALLREYRQPTGEECRRSGTRIRSQSPLARPKGLPARNTAKDETT
jgi:hypothetical protein